jgi:tRNA dimethylallyltransferase
VSLPNRVAGEGSRPSRHSARVTVLAGPTASGKTALALDLAREWGLEVVSADAMMVYRGLDVGTAKPSLAERAAVPHHVIDVVDPDEDYSVAQWVVAAEKAISWIISRGKVPLVVGGTGFYVRSLSEGLPSTPPSKPAEIARLEQEMRERGLEALTAELERASPADARRAQDNPRRVLRYLEVLRSTGRPPSAFPARPAVYRYQKVVLDPPPGELADRIERRTRTMLEGGLLEEAAGLRRLFERSGRRPTALQAIGYREAADVLAGRETIDEAAVRISLATRQYAKRQRTWFRREPGATLVGSTEEAAAKLRKVFSTH